MGAAVLTAKLQAFQARMREQTYPHFAWLMNEDIPWTAPARPLRDATVALLSTCGLYCLDSQAAFDTWNDAGDPSFREIHLDTPADRLAISHSHYDRQHVAADVNVALPAAHFRQLAADGITGPPHPRAYSFMGYLPEPFQLIRKTGPQVAAGWRRTGRTRRFSPRVDRFASSPWD